MENVISSIKDVRKYHRLTKEIILFKEYFDIKEKDLGKKYAEVYSILKKKFVGIEVETIQEIFLWSTDEELNCRNDTKYSLKRIIKHIKWASVARLQGISHERHGFQMKNHWQVNDY
tara:strand:- start:37 stop:387 length:351 start_codon:yes stop_codon:yes gene_type:complete